MLDENGICEYYLPEGEYTHLLTNEVKKGGRYYREQFDYLNLPVYVRPDTILPVGNTKVRPDYDYLQDISYHIFSLGDEADIKLNVYNTDSKLEETLALIKKEGKITIKRNCSKKAAVVLRNISEIIVV